MLYSLYDMKTQAMAPFLQGARIARSVFSHPANPWAWTMQGRMVSAGVNVLESLVNERQKPEWHIPFVKIDGEKIQVYHEIVMDSPFCALRRFSLQKQFKTKRKAIFLLAPMSGHYATLLRDTVRRLLVDADIYITDWHNARNVPLSAGNFGLSDYIKILIESLEKIGDNSDMRARTHCIAVCQPAPLLLAATAILAAKNHKNTPQSITLMGGPIDTRAASTLVTRLAENRPLSWFKHTNIHPVPNQYKGRGRHVYPGFVQLRAFWSMNPARHNMAHWNMFKHLVRGDEESASKSQEFYNEYMAVMDVPAEFYLETIHHIFQNHSLAEGKFSYENAKVDLSAIERVGVMTVEGMLDDISAPGQTVAAHELCPNVPDAYRRQFLVEEVGHYGIFNGRKWREVIAPNILTFMNEIDQMKETNGSSCKN